MGRLRRHITLGMLLALALAALQLGGAASAWAATTCKSYDGFPTDDGTTRAARICVAPASDFPSHSGWGRVVETYVPGPGLCSFGLLPYDIDEPRPMMACPAVMPAPVPAWRWNGRGWVAVSSSALLPGARAWFAPYATGWHWAWTPQTGWVAIESSHAAYRWYA